MASRRPVTTHGTKPRAPQQSSKKRGSGAEKWGCTACRGFNQQAKPNIQGKGKACGVGRCKVAARSVGAHVMCTTSGRRVAQSNRLGQVLGASKQLATTHHG
eukprot:356623-Chlamydomonas_euryale.AAC.10